MMPVQRSKRGTKQTYRRAYVQNEGGVGAEEHIVQPRDSRQVLKVVGEPGEHPRHAVVRLHLIKDKERKNNSVRQLH